MVIYFDIIVIYERKHDHQYSHDHHNHDGKQSFTFQELPVGESAFAPFLHQIRSVMSTAHTWPWFVDDDDNDDAAFDDGDDNDDYLSTDSDCLVLSIHRDPIFPSRTIHAYVSSDLWWWSS